jgi:hypothetical protein
MRISDTLVTVLGVSCVASAAILAVAPGRSTDTLGLPASSGLGRALALRDVTIGAALLSRSMRSPGLVLRQMSDAFDAGLALASIARGRRGSAPVLTIAGALALSASAWLLRRATQPSTRALGTD